MTIEEFVEKMEICLANFQEDWYCKSLIDSVNYNTDAQMSKAEWIEQFELYLEELS